jgi:hypothetical protein
LKVSNLVQSFENQTQVKSAEPTMANNNQQHVANSNHQQPQNVINNKQQVQRLQQQPLQQQQQPTQHNHNGTAKKPPVIMAKSNGDIRHGGVHLIAPPKSQDSSVELGKTTVLATQIQQQQQRQPLQQRQETRGSGQQQQQQRNEPFGLISSSAAPPVSTSKTIATSPVQSELSGGIGGGCWEHDFTGYPQRPPAKTKTKIIYDLGTPEMNSQGRRETKK